MQPNAEKWPRLVKRGGGEARIYRIKNRDRTAYQVAYWVLGARKLKNFARFADAYAHADEQALLLNSGRLGVAGMQEHDREAFAAASRLLQPLGIPLVEAVKTFVTAVKEIDGRGSLIDAAKEFRTNKATELPRKTVPQVVDEFLAAKEQDGASYRYLKTLRSQLARSADNGRKRNSFADFAEAAALELATVQARDIDDWLRRRAVGPRTRRNFILSIRVLFNYAKTRGYLPKNKPTEADAVTLPKPKGGAIGIFTPEQLAQLMSGSEKHPANEEYRLWLALGAFSGLRTEELKRLEWQDVKLSTGYLEVTAQKAKTGSRRLVPILPNLAAWLASYSGSKGKVFPRERAEERVHAYAERLGIQWPSNALRHSFATYRLATIFDTARTAIEMGNSPAIIVKHYRELATEAEGKAWFAIAPEQPANVVTMRARG